MKWRVPLLSPLLGAVFVLAFFAPTTAGVLEYVYTDVDTYKVVDVMGSPGATIKVPIYFANDTLVVTALRFRLEYDNTMLTAIGVSIDSTRLDGLNWMILWDSPGPGVFKFVGYDLLAQNYVHPGSGPVAFVYFQIAPGFTQGEALIRFEDDPSSIPPIQNEFSDSAATADYIPIQVDGRVGILHGDNQPPTLDPIGPKTVVKYDSLCFVVTASDPDPEDTSLHYFIDTSDLAGCADWHAEIDELTGRFCFHAGHHFVPPRPHDMTFQIIFCVNDFSPTPPESLQDCEMVVFTLNEPPFTLEVKKVFTFPGQQHAKVPFFLSNPWDEVGGWEVLIEHDPSGGTVVGVTLCDSARVDDEAHGGPDTVFYAPWNDDPSLRPEWFSYQLNANGHSNWVRVVGIQNMAYPQVVTPDLPRDEQMVLFCLIFDVSPEWDGHNIVFNFRTKNCTDNTVTDSEGQELWGPHPESPYPPSRPNWLRCPYDPYVMLLGGHGIGVQTVVRGDINCDCVPYSVADAMMFIGYLVNGNSALRDDSGEYYCGSFEAHTYAGDIDGDGHGFTINDLIKLIRVINGYEDPLPNREATELTVSLDDGRIAVDKGIGAARLVFHGEGEVRGDDVAFAHRHNKTIVVAYTLENRVLDGELFSIAGDVTLESVEAADFHGGSMVVTVVTVPTAPLPVPSSFALAQNYPNPFNPATEIRYELPEARRVLVQVFNVLGQHVATLVDADQEAGYYAVTWDGSGAASGVYLYRIEAGKFEAMRKMVLLK